VRQLLGGDFPPLHRPVADLPVLAEHAAQRAPGEKHRAAATAAADGRLLPKVQGRPGNAHLAAPAAHPAAPLPPWDAAVPGAQPAGGNHGRSASMAQLLPRWPLVLRWENTRSLSHMVHTCPTVMCSARTPAESKNCRLHSHKSTWYFSRWGP